MDDPSLDFETLAAHAGVGGQQDEAVPTVGPIVPSSTFTYKSVRQVHDALTEEGSGFAYSRNANPTVASLEHAVGLLEGAEGVVAFGSGMAAMHAALLASGMKAGSRVVAAGDMYGVTRTLLHQLATFDISTHLVDVQDHDAVAAVLDEVRPSVFLFESISNPLLRVADVRRLVEIARSMEITTVIDNTFATPFLLRPLEVGVDVVVHSATKYIAGHGDVVAGLVAGSKLMTERVRTTRTTTGGILSPFEAWLTLRGIKTLPLRMASQCANAEALAEWLVGREWITRVYYPGLSSNPQRTLAGNQFGRAFGAMVSFDLLGNRDDAIRFMDSLRLITPGTSLGDVESLILYPALTSHRGFSPQARETAGIGDGLLRLSVGLESVKDLVADLAEAARAAGLREKEPEAVTSNR